MKLVTSGSPLSFNERLVGRIARVPERDLQRRADLVLTTSVLPDTRADLVGYRALLTTRPAPAHLTITGGEPTLLGEGLLRIVAELKRCLPETHVHVLTNGRRFAWPELTASLAALEHPRLTLGIPLYSDTAWEHDFVVQAS